ncbi:SAM_USH1G_HARP domain-containing protein Sans isoform X2 [Musca autumnalis]|uniref:SAM_USH1G_HARP domain-containing protein Sans isoform X2 n=1 Tax=Musca autumnalis TaxID=221902 RepID=UPI003CEFBEEE
MSSERFHKAAKDGLLDVLKEATRKDANSKDDDSMTPVLWSAFEGHLEALRLLCGRGGDPDKCDQFGNTALHLAAAKGHLRCVDFLVKFGVNIYALDIDKHSAKDLAAINNRDEILRYLDAATANFEATDRKKAKAMKELAEKNCEKRIKEYMKRQQKQDQEQKEPKSPTPATNGKSGKMLSTLKQKIWSSQGNLHKIPKENSPTTVGSGVKFSELVQTGGTGSTGGSVASRKGNTISSKSKEFSGVDSGFKIGEIEPDGRRTITSLSGVQRDSEILYVGTFSSNEDNCKRGKINGLFESQEEAGNSDNESSNNKASYGTLSRSFSQPDILGDNEPCDSHRPEIQIQRPSGLFDRPMLGSIAFRRSVTAALSQLNTDVYSGLDENSATTTTQSSTRTSSICSKSRSAKQRSFLNLTDSDSDGADGFSDDDDQDVAGGPIQRFLTVWGLEEYLHIFQKQQIDLDTLLLLTEADLKSLGLPLGPFRKLSFAIQERKNALSNPGAIRDSHL